MGLEANLNPALISLVSLTMGLTQVYKMLLPTDDLGKIAFKIMIKAIPLVALLIGIFLSMVYEGELNYQSLESGIVVGLTAAGVYSGGKTILNKKEIV
jgi:hypothetical protein